ncbi:hypothetical protein Tco_1444188 [Tanacetum coccineum]
MGRHEHGNQKSTKEATDSKPKPREAKDSKPKPEKVKLQSNGQTLAKKSQLTKGQIPNVSFQPLQVSNVTQLVFGFVLPILKLHTTSNINTRTEFAISLKFKKFYSFSVENGAKGLVTVHSSSTSYSRVKTKGFCQLKG